MIDVDKYAMKSASKKRGQPKKKESEKPSHIVGMSKNVYLSAQALNKREEIMKAKGSFSSYINELIAGDME